MLADPERFRGKTLQVNLEQNWRETGVAGRSPIPATPHQFRMEVPHKPEQFSVAAC